MEIKSGSKRAEPKSVLKKLLPAAPIIVASLWLVSCGPQAQNSPQVLQTPLSSPPESSPGQEQPFISSGEIMSGDTWKGAVARLFGNLYPDFKGYTNLENYSAVIGESRLSQPEGSNFTCVVFPDKISAEQGTDLLYGDGVGDPDNLLGPMWVGQQLAVGKTDSLSAEMAALQCGDEYWQVSANREYSTDPGKQTINLEMTRRKVDENGHALTTGLAVFKFSNGDFNNWQGEWEVNISGKWLPASRLREKLGQGIDFNDAIIQLEKEVKQQSSNKLVDPKNLRGTARDPRNPNPWKQASRQGYTTKPRRA